MRILLVVMVLLFSCSVFGQDNDSVMYTDVYAGIINGVSTTLTLRHCRYCDMGTYKLVEKKKGNAEHIASGEWTVLRGDAVNRNAVVVDLYSGGREYYYLRKDRSVLVRLDSSLRVIQPQVRNTLRKRQVSR